MEFAIGTGGVVADGAVADGGIVGTATIQAAGSATEALADGDAAFLSLSERNGYLILAR